ncbi:mechanosensitive ion channel family protein [uncultured Jatrophihabitans sp.]|uniref:mechanosensitive ion channel family protein n=1 Tax=uncultured Jatrophihabitans sp. TaxID=1610747 RepID=UPI0035CA6582
MDIALPPALAMPAALRPTVLPKFLHDHRRVLIEIPIRIVVIILVALILRAVLRRMIGRLVRPATSDHDTPRLLRPFKERLEGSSFLESAGLLSERRKQRAATLGSVLKSATSITIFVVAFLLVLSELQIDLAPFIAGTSIVGVALGFGAQNIVKDFLSGMFMLLEDQYGVGDVIDFEKASGTVEAVGLRSTRLRDVNGTVWYVRNGEVVRVGNKSQGFAQVVLDIPIDASAEVDRAAAAMRETALAMAAEEDWEPVFLSAPEVQGVESMTREETVIRLVAKVRPLEQWRTARELRRRIRERLDRLDIDTPDQPDADPAPAGPAQAGPAPADDVPQTPPRSNDAPQTGPPPA